MSDVRIAGIVVLSLLGTGDLVLLIHLIRMGRPRP